MIRKEVLKEDLNHIISRTCRVWSQVYKKKIFLTGGTGFLGKWLLESFIFANKQFNLKAEIHVLSRNPKAFQQKYPYLAEDKHVVFHQGDVRNFRFPKCCFEYIIHAATDTNNQLNKNESLILLDTVQEGTRRVLELARSCEASRFLYISSGAVYGKQPRELSHISEDYSGAPNQLNSDSAYGEAKRLAELLCSIYQEQYGVHVNIARCFTFVGPYLNLDIHFAIGNFIRDGLEKKTIRIKGDGTPYRSYLYAADLAIWLWTILIEGEYGHAYNVGSAKAISILNLAKKISSKFHPSHGVYTSKLPDTSILPSRYVPNIERAYKELGLRSWVDLDTAISRTIQFYTD